MIDSFNATSASYGLKLTILLVICILIAPTASQVCGDGSFNAATQACNDGNYVNGDGCSSTCQVEKNYSCVNTAGAVSICRISVPVNLTYVGTIRDTSSNSAINYFTILPFYSAFTRINFNGLLSHSLINCTIPLISYSQE